MNKRVYLDAAAGRGNPSSIHAEGVLAAAKLAEARRKVAGVLACQPDEIIFTSGGTESNNLAVFGVGKGHRVFSSIEHSSILQTDLRATFVPVDADGLVNLKDLKKALRPETVLVSIAYANNEIGTIQPIREIAKIIRHYRKANSSKLTANSFPLFHTDACQAPRYLDLNVARLGVDLMSLNGAKVGGPKGVGCLYVRRGIKLQPMLVGGGQERGLRAGTENVEGIIRFAKALEAAAKNREKESKRLSALRDYFISKLLKNSGTELNGSPAARLPNNINISFQDVLAEQLVIELDAKGVAASTGSACSAQTKDESYVIIALGKSTAEAQNSIRFTLGPEMTKSDINYVLKVLPLIIKKIRSVV